jgi:predicted O-linked N-acetylglucosamine transferase (SPINDLY family)
MGSDFFDYIVGDETLVRQSEQQDYSEKIVYMPNSYQVNDTKSIISEKVFSRADMGLKQNGFVFCCFNNSYKIVPEVFDCWIRIMKKVEGSVLWLPASNETATRNLRMEANARGLDPGRLIFANKLPAHPDHLARLQLADLFLDTLPYNAHTTASDALRAGLPVLTRTGETFAGRVATSLLNAIGLPELVTRTREEYENLGIGLATHPAKLAFIKEKLARNRLTAPLFNTQLFTRHIESAYRAMHERYQAGLPPDHLNVAP